MEFYSGFGENYVSSDVEFEDFSDTQIDIYGFVHRGNFYDLSDGLFGELMDEEAGSDLEDFLN